MTYIQGFLIPSPAGNRDAYHALAAKAAPIFAEHGAQRIVECWGDDIPDGKRTDMKRAVAAKPDETIAYSWIYWPDKATCDAASSAMMSDERMKPDGDEPMPFDMQRMIYGGFECIHDTGDGGAFGYVDGMVAAVPNLSKDAYVAHATTAADIFRDHGAVRLVETWGIDVPAGKVTDFHRAVAAEPGETIVFSWIEWPDKAARNAGMGAVMQDERMAAMQMPFDGSRMIFGGFVPILDTDHN